MSGRQRRISTWPVICILGCLFVLSLAAPRAWEQAARRQAASELLEQAAVADPAASEEAAAAGPVQLSPQPPVVPTQALLVPEVTDEPQAQAAHPAEKIASHPVDFADPSVAVPAIEEQMMAEASRRDLPDDEDAAPADLWTESEESADPGEWAEEQPVAADGAEGVGPSLLTSMPSTVGQTREPAPLRLERLPEVTKPAPAAKAEAFWKVPPSLRTRLEKLAAEPGTAAWAGDVDRLLEKLVGALSSGSDQTGRLMGELSRRAAQAERLAEKLQPAKAAELRRTAHAVIRRVELWKLAVQISGPELKSAKAPQADPQRLALCLANLKGLDGHSPMSDAWQKYILVDALKGLSQGRVAAGRQESRDLARRVLTRITQVPMNDRQRALVKTSPMVALRSELQRWAAEPADLARLVGAVEEFESGGLASDGRRVALEQYRMTFSPVKSERELAAAVDSYYRNANVRLVLTKTLMNRLLPEPKAEYEPVRDTILGYPVRGRSLNQPELAVDFIPDPERLLMQFQVRGWVSSSTSSTAGPATFFDSSNAYYEAKKPLEIQARGIRLEPAEVSAYSNSRLQGLRTNFDGIPILGAVVQNIARNKHEERKPEAAAEVEYKISARAKERIDQEASTRLSEGVERMRERVFTPLAELGLDPVMIESQTSAERMTMRLRLAAEQQLGSQTPRPRAPSDSLATVQLHETAVNNLLERMDLEGRTFTAAQLSQYIADKLHREPWPCQTEHDDATIRFAAKDAMTVRFQDGRLILTLAVAELRNPPRAWRDFRVRVCYRPVVQGRSAELARVGVVQLIGRLSTGSQIAVRGIFSKTFPKNTTWRIMPDRLADDPKLADLSVSQFAIEDGWLSLALSASEKTALRRAPDRRRR